MPNQTQPNQTQHQHWTQQRSQHQANLRHLESQDVIYAQGEKPTYLANQIQAEKNAIAALDALLANMPLTLSEDGNPISDEETLSPPEPRFQMSPLVNAPGGAVKLRDRLYVERQADHDLRAEMVDWGTTTTVRASRQTGRSSLLARGKYDAQKQGHSVVLIDFEQLTPAFFETPDKFLYNLAAECCQALRLDETDLERAWKRSQGPQKKLTNFLEDVILPYVDKPLPLIMDEADHLLEKTAFYQDFFGLVRSWHNRRAFEPEQWEKFNIVMSISTEPAIPATRGRREKLSRIEQGFWGI